MRVENEKIANVLRSAVRTTMSEFMEYGYSVKVADESVDFVEIEIHCGGYLISCRFALECVSDWFYAEKIGDHILIGMNEFGWDCLAFEIEAMLTKLIIFKERKERENGRRIEEKGGKASEKSSRVVSRREILEEARKGIESSVEKAVGNK